MEDESEGQRLLREIVEDEVVDSMTASIDVDEDDMVVASIDDDVDIWLLRVMWMRMIYGSFD